MTIREDVNAVLDYELEDIKGYEYIDNDDDDEILLCSNGIIVSSTVMLVFNNEYDRQYITNEQFEELNERLNCMIPVLGF